MNKFLLAAYIVLFSVNGISQNKQIDVIPFATSSLVADNLGNFYTFRKSTIQKFSATDHDIIEYTDFSNGSIGSIDVSNPFKILVYYNDFNAVQFLDRYLAPIGDIIQLDVLGIINPADISGSLREGFWVLNQTSRKAELYDMHLKKEISTFLISSVSEVPVNQFKLSEQAGYLLLFSSSELLIFDHLGIFRQKIEVANQYPPTISDNKIYCFAESSISIYDLKLKSLKEFPLPRGNWQYMNYQNNRLVLLRNDTITRLKFP